MLPVNVRRVQICAREEGGLNWIDCIDDRPWEPQAESISPQVKFTGVGFCLHGSSLCPIMTHELWRQEFRESNWTPIGLSN